MWWMVLLACGPIRMDPADPVTSPPTTSTTTTGPNTTPTGPTTDTPPDDSRDAELARDLIAGNVGVDEVMPEIAWSGGWPVDDDGVWIFVYPESAGAPSLAGDFNEWAPAAMTAGDGFFWAEVEIADASGMKYKFVESDDWFADEWSRSYTYDDFGRISYVAPTIDDFHLERWRGLDGAGLASRDVRVYVPPGVGPWPVLYMHDGQNLFDPESMWGGWRLQETLPTVAPMLVVGVDNTQDRFDEYTHVPDDIGYGDVMGGEGDAYAALMHETLRPHIEARYLTSGKNGQLGSSLGGLISLNIAQLYPGEYEFAGSMSGTLGWGRFGLFNETMEERWLADPPPISVFVDSGGDAGAGGCQDLNGDGSYADDPDATDNYCTSLGFAEALAADGFTWDQDLWHWYEPGEPHNEMAWAARVFRPLELFGAL